MHDITLITTTINVPHVLKRYRELEDNIVFVVAGDRKSPHEEIHEIAKQVGNMIYLEPEDQVKWNVSDAIGWNSIQRRNIALLEAMRLGGDYIVTIDDDNAPFEDYFLDHVRGLNATSGLVAHSDSGWWNVGSTLKPSVVHRGFSLAHRHDTDPPHVGMSTELKIGVNAGLWYGDPDIDAVERIGKSPAVLARTDLALEGIALEVGTYCPYNTQNTAIISKFAPLFHVIPGVGRYDDIWASYVGQTVMWKHGYTVRYGDPMVWQSRNDHDLTKDLENEIYGMRHTDGFVEVLRNTALRGDNVVDDMYTAYTAVEHMLPPQSQHFIQAWMADLNSLNL